MGIERLIALNEFKSFLTEFTEYSFGEAMYAVGRVATKGSNKLSDLLEVSSEEMVSAIEEAIDYERNE